MASRGWNWPPAELVGQVPEARGAFALWREHHEIARYGTMIAWANQLGMCEAASLLKQTLDQECGADQLLTKLAEGQLNRQAPA